MSAADSNSANALENATGASPNDETAMVARPPAASGGELVAAQASADKQELVRLFQQIEGAYQASAPSVATVADKAAEEPKEVVKQLNTIEIKTLQGKSDSADNEPAVVQTRSKAASQAGKVDWQPPLGEDGEGSFWGGLKKLS